MLRVSFGVRYKTLFTCRATFPRAISNDLKARDQLGHTATHQTWQSVLAVLVAFRAKG